MRRYKKKEILETVDMLLEAHEVICRLCKSNTERALELLGQCQESAILLGNLIESRGEQYAELIKVLEDYCENIYQVSTTLSDENLTRKQSRKIQKQLIYLNNKIRLEMPEDKKEVVFFPYKASMWDSLESVWMAADADEGTDAYVVPIPYYDKNPDGSFRERHYEGNEYPDYVPVTDYKEYDFEERRPDVMYIHNPYDEFNYVTSVDPRYYSSNLKQFTDKLVYIPYFILGEVKLDDEAAIEGMKHFCSNAAVRNADKVIVQSEEMRQVYIKVLSEEAGGSKEARAYWEKKIDGSGSPKVDKVLRTKKEDLNIPEEWMKVIQKPDGSWKKIIFYNTSVTALLQHDEQMLRKIESVFQIFRENKDEVAFLWRPHPLIESTLISMRPELWDSYRKIREQYKEEGWGIYDDTADMDRAVILSDAYYGDGSSVVHLCKKAQKPVMIQNVEITIPVPEEVSLWFLDAYIEDDKIWFASNDFNGLYVGNLKSGEVQKVADFPGESKLLDYMYIGVQQKNSKLYFIPGAAAKLAIYDMKENSFEMVRIPLSQEFKADFSDKFQSSLIYKNKLFLFGYDLCIFEYDMGSKEIKHHNEISRVIKSAVPTGKMFSLNCVLDTDIAYMVIRNTNVVVEFGLENKNVKCHKIGDIENQYLTITKQGNNIWLAGINVIVCWNIQSNVVEKIVGKKKDAEAIYEYTKDTENEIIFFEAKNKRNIKIDIESREVRSWISQKTKQPYNRGWDSIIPISDSDYYLDTGDYTMHTLKNDNYIRRLIISKNELFRLIKDENNYYTILQERCNVEGGVSATYALEFYIFKVIHSEEQV